MWKPITPALDAITHLYSQTLTLELGWLMQRGDKMPLAIFSWHYASAPTAYEERGTPTLVTPRR